MPKIEDWTPTYKNPLCCPSCGEYRRIEDIIVPKERDWKTVMFRNFFYICNNCKTRELSILKSQVSFFEHISKTEPIEQDDWTFVFWNPKWSLAYDYLWFGYDWLDYYGIPWLTRPRDNWQLVPVFFKKDLLSYFNHNPNYKVRMHWRSVANIYKKWDDWWEEITNWGIWINRNDNLFMFLWDLKDYIDRWDISESELRIRKACNIKSDHDVISDLYFQQIEACFTTLDNERKIFEQIEEANQLSKKTLWFELFEFDRDKVDEEYKHPIFNEKDQVARSVNLLCQFIIESIHAEAIEKYLLEKNIKTTDKNWNKFWTLNLLKLIIGTITHDNLCNWLFILYDIEITSWHKKSAKWHEEIIKSCFERLWKEYTDNYLILFKTVVAEIISNLDSLIRELEK